MKEALMKSLILVYPDPNRKHALFTDASKYIKNVKKLSFCLADVSIALRSDHLSLQSSL